MKRAIRRVEKRMIPEKLFVQITGDYYTENIAAAKKDIFKNKSLLERYGAEIRFLKKEGGLTIFPYKFTEKYNADKIKVYIDGDVGMRYVLHDGKKLYFPETWSEGRIKDYYNGLLIEQDKESPHRYFTKDFKVEKGDVFVDVGCAEAMSSLECVDDASEIYLFECDEMWLKALERTFEKYGDKVHIIRKYARSYTDHESVKLEDALRKSFGKTFFIKLDLNGYEWDTLGGSPELIRTQRIKCAGCTYHRQEDEDILLSSLKREGFTCEFSKGYMLFIFSELKYPYFRRGLIRAKKCE